MWKITKCMIMVCIGETFHRICKSLDRLTENVLIVQMVAYTMVHIKTLFDVLFS